MEAPVTVAVPLLGGAVIPVGFPSEAQVGPEPGARDALDAFLALTIADRRAITHHLKAYARDSWTGRSAFRTLWPGRVWAQIAPTALTIIDEGGVPYVTLLADCPWEKDRGLSMVWREGRHLCKIGPQDGLVTHEDSGPPGRGPVYKSRTGRFDTYA